MSISENLNSFTEKLAGKNVFLLAVSKKKPSSLIREAFEAGQKSFGENYVQEALEKQQDLKDLEIDWHFIGRIQSKKIKDLVGNFHLIHSLDRLDLAEKISTRAQELRIVQDCLLQINIGEEETKGGFVSEELSEIASQIISLKGIRIRGVMSFPPLTDNENLSREYFSKTYKTFESLKERMDSSFDTLSMGTTSDYEWAIKEGSNMIRVGTAIFGQRD